MLDLDLREEFSEKKIEVTELSQAPASSDDVCLRRYPFPYRAALAISNDPRGVQHDSFLSIHRAFAERGLEISAAASFDENDITSISAPITRELNEARLLDSVVGLPAGGVIEANTLLEASGLTPECFIGGASVFEAVGLMASGIKFFTDESFLSREKFGEENVYRANGELRARLSQFSFDQFSVPGGENEMRLMTVLDAMKGSSRRTKLIALFNSMLLPMATDDYSDVQVFKRFSGPQRPAAPLLPLQLRSLFLTTLEAKQGAVVVHQRLGDIALIGMSPETENRHSASSPVFGIHELTALDDLADRSKESILVATTSRLLNWLSLIRNLNMDVEKTESGWHVQLKLDDPHRPHHSLNLAELEGLAVTVPATAPEVKITFPGSDHELPVRRGADLFQEDIDCIYIPWRKRPWPNL
jgi:hypothetical protein